MTIPTPNSPPPESANTTAEPRSRNRAVWLALLFAIAGIATFAVAALLVTIFEHRQEARTPFVRLVEVDEITTDPAPWGTNWPMQFDSYVRTVDDERTQYGLSSALPQSKLDEPPWLRRLYAGYAFSLDYREARGHAYMLHDQEVTERVTKRSQSGACLHCHASIIPTYRRIGMESLGEEVTDETLAADFNWPAVMEGFRIASAMDYAAAHAEVLKTPDGTPDNKDNPFPGGTHPPATPDRPQPAGDDADSAEATIADGRDSDPHLGQAHPVSCVDCHDPESMRIRVTRPGFVNGLAALAKSDDPLPHLPSMQRWREGKRDQPYDPNKLASRQEMRTFVCAQCHVEYYCASKETLFYPWDNGLKVEQIEAMYDDHKFPDGSVFYDFAHAETGAPLYKAQHPEFELWSQGIHARSGVSCSDCHMPYQRQGAMKVSSHWVRSPLFTLNSSCQTCHNVSEADLKERVETIQNRTTDLIERAAVAMTDMLDAIREAQANGASKEELAPILDLQRKAMWRLDFISSENSRGFHADQEAARILAESIDFSRQAQTQALRLRAGDVETDALPEDSVEGVTPTEKAPPHPGEGN